MANSKDVNKAIVKEQFYRLGQIVDKAKAAQDAYQSELSKVDGYSKDYSPEYLTGLKDKVLGAYKAKRQALYQDTMTQLEKLSGALTELNGSLDLASPALSNALSLIQMTGNGLTFETAQKINANFINDQSSLRALQEAYRSAGVVSDGGLDRQIYDPTAAMQALGQYAQEALVQDGFSPFRLGVEFGKIAKLENIDFKQGNPFPSMVNEPTSFDTNKVTDSARAAAGLPPEAK